MNVSERLNNYSHEFSPEVIERVSEVSEQQKSIPDFNQYQTSINT